MRLADDVKIIVGSSKADNDVLDEKATPEAFDTVNKIEVLIKEFL